MPLPVEGGRPFHVVLDAALISVKSKPMSPIIFQVPPQRFFPLMDLDFAGPLRCMSVDVMLAVFLLMLREAKLIFISCSNTMLTETMETLRMLLFPLMWSSCFVSRLPTSLHGLLQAPGGLMIGVHMEQIQPSHAEVKKFIQHMHRSYPLVTGTYVVDLTSNSIHQFDGKALEKLQQHDVDNILKTMPIGPKVRLRAKLMRIAEDYHIAPQTVGLEEMDSAFDFQDDSEDAISREKWDAFPTLEMRDSFMSFMIDLLGDYPKYILPPVEDMFAETYRTFREEFAVEEYLADSDPSCRPTLDYLMETQMFSVLLQNRSEGNAEAVVFFEQAAELQRELGLSVGGHGHGIVRSPHGICEVPAPIYTLLNKEQEWSALSKTMQQQILTTLEATGKRSYRIVVLSQNSLSPIRGNNAHAAWNASFQNISNQKLLDLLTFNDFTHATPQHYQDNESDSPYYFVARKELDRQEDLHLGNEEFGPVIVAGPTLNGTMDYIPPDEENAKVYTYPSWPELQHDVLTAGEGAVHPRVKEIQAARILTLNQLNPSLYRMIRSPAERLASVGNHLGKAKDHDKQLHVSAEVAPMLAAMMDIASVSMLLITLRILNNVKPNSDILQLLGIIAELEQVGMLPSLNESIWRSLMVGCGAVGGTIMRRIVYVLFQCMESVRAKSANALTYGRYVQALNAKKLNFPETSAPGDILDPFLYLEEIGYTWYIQKSALSAQNQSINQEDNSQLPRKNSAGSDNSVHGSYGVSSKNMKKNVLLQANTESARIVAAKLNLQSNRAFLPFMKPIQTAAFSIPIPTSHLSANGHSVEYVRAKAKLQIEAFLQSCTPSNFKAYPNPPTPKSRTDSRQSLDRKGSRESIGTPDRLSSMINSIGSEIGRSSTMHIVSKLSTGPNWLLGLGKNNVAIRNAPDNSRQTPKINPSLQSSNNHGSSWRSFFGSRTPTPASTPPPNHITHSTPEAALHVTPIKEDGHVDMKKLDALASTLLFEDDEENISHASDEDTSQHDSKREVSVSKGDKELQEMTEVRSSVHSNTPAEESEETGIDTNVSSPPATNATDSIGSDADDLHPLKLADQSQLSTIHEVNDPVHNETATRTGSSTTTPAAKELNMPEFNNKVLDMFIQHYMDTGKVLSIHNSTPCLDCGYVLMDEEILAVWCRTAGIDIHNSTANNRSSSKSRNRSASQIVMDTSYHHKIICPHCSNEVKPKLHVHEHSKVKNTSDHPLMPPGCEVEVQSKFLEEVSFVSPFLLRTEVEEALLKVGDKLVDMDTFHHNSATIFWNTLWYTSRCTLPSGMCATTRTSFYHLPLVIAWRQDIAVTKAKRILQGIPGDMLEVKDILPYASEEELKVIYDLVLTNLDCSPAGMRQALVHMSQVSSMYLQADEQKTSIARMLYTTLMLLAVYAGHFQVFDRRKTSLARDLSQVLLMYLSAFL